MNTFDTIVRGGTVVHHNCTEFADIGVTNGKIAAVGDLSKAKGTTEIQAAGKRVIPGGIDPHTHLDSEYAGLRGGDSVHSGTIAAAFGGTTCLIDFAAGAETLTERVAARHRFFAYGEPVVDFGFHCVIGSESTKMISQIGDLVGVGVSSVKYYMNNTDAMSDGVLLAVLQAAKQAGVLVCVHAENEQIAQLSTQQLVQKGQVRWCDFPQSRPEICEREAVGRAISLAEAAKTGIYFVHLSAGMSAKYLKKAREGDRPFYGETCAHYLTLTDEVFSRENGELYKVTPPLRKQKDQQQLWEALGNGVLQTLGSDHVSYTIEEKRRQLQSTSAGKLKQDFTKVPDGLPGVELRLPTLVNGVLDGRISWEELVRINSYNPARLFGLYPRKGEIACGFDADLVLLNDQRNMKITDHSKLHMNCDHTPYEGLTYRCIPETVLLRGQPVIADGKYTGVATGEYLHRNMDISLLKSSRTLH